MYLVDHRNCYKVGFLPGILVSLVKGKLDRDYFECCCCSGSYCGQNQFLAI